LSFGVTRLAASKKRRAIEAYLEEAVRFKDLVVEDWPG